MCSTRSVAYSTRYQRGRGTKMLSQLVKEHPYISYHVVLLMLFLLCQKVLRLWCKKNKATMSIPGNRGLVFVGETLQFMAAINSSKGVYDFVRVRRLRYGNYFKTKLFGETHVFISRTESAKVILNNEGGKFSKKYIKSIAELVGSDSLLCAAQQHHKLIRCRLFSLFSTASLSSFVKLFDAMVLEAMSSWSCGSIVVIQDETLKLACKAMCKMLISVESSYELMVMQKEVSSICDAMLSFPLRLLGTRFYKGLKARKKIMDMLEKEISERRSGVGTRRVDFLQQLLENDDKLKEDEVPKLTDTEIKDNILTMMIAGQDTVANAMTWMVKFVDENQEVLNELMKEQVQIDKKGTRSGYLTLEALNEMQYASKVVKEALRMASVVQWFPRVALQDCDIEGFKIKKGWNINIDARSIHLDPIVHNDPDVFNPSRFSDESKPYSFLAFGMGARTCLGKNMAKAMLLVFLHRLITTYKWKVIDSDSSIQKWALFTKLKSGCPVRLTSMKKDTCKTI
ncbi:PREDICTED: abscisic acid 8'-hydroxylase 4 isoform X2 [Lupinus angustifolius]|nr:PREDICTED: abscisic acid 8'-hydroxylase 4 isoform X2 [Lupinus angustifolius]